MADDDPFGRHSGGDLPLEWDDDALGWHVDGGASGPAGLAKVELPGGVEIDIDVAEPDEILGVWVPDVDDATEARRIVDAATADRISLARLALADDVLDEEFGPSELAVALAMVDRALASRAFEQLLGTTELTNRLTQAIEAIHADTESLFGARRPELIADALRELHQRDRPDAALDALLEALRDAGREQRAAGSELPLAAAAPMASEATFGRDPRLAPGGWRLDIVDPDGLPNGLRPEQVVARATSPSEIEIRVGAPVPATPWWVRVHRHDDLILAVAPVLADGPDMGVARLLVPPDLLDHLEVDLAARPDEPRPSAALRSIDRAVRQGRGAARLERTERYADAERTWRDCARGWERARDMPRTRAALERSRNIFPQGTARNPTGGPLLSDLVDR